MNSDGKPWQAHHAFELMESCIGDVTSIPSSAHQKMVDAMATWSAVLMQGHMSEKAISVVEDALLIDPINDDLDKNRWTLLNEMASPAKAIAARREYQDALRNSGFSEAEIEAVTSDLWTRERPADIRS